MKTLRFLPLFAIALLPLSPLIAAEDTGETGARVERMLDEIVFPSLNFTNVPLNRAIETLSTMSTDLDPDEVGVSILMRSPDADWPTVSVHLHNMPLRRVLSFVTQQTGYTFERETDVIIVRPYDGRHKIEFPGGPLRDFIDYVSEIAQAHGETLNVHVTDEAAEKHLPRVHFRALTLQDAIQAASSILVIEHPEYDWRLRNQAGGIWMISVSEQPSRTSALGTRVYSLGLAGTLFSNDDITTAMEIAWELDGLSSDDVTVRIHDETGLIYIRGNDAALGSAASILRALQSQAEAELQGEEIREVLELYRRDEETGRAPTDEQLRRAAEELRLRRAARQSN
jgi:hypothetical protein